MEKGKAGGEESPNKARFAQEKGRRWEKQQENAELGATEHFQGGEGFARTPAREVVKKCQQAAVTSPCVGIWSAQQRLAMKKKECQENARMY